jgi:hypothetical protein
MGTTQTSVTGGVHGVVTTRAPVPECRSGGGLACGVRGGRRLQVAAPPGAWGVGYVRAHVSCVLWSGGVCGGPRRRVVHARARVGSGMAPTQVCGAYTHGYVCMQYRDEEHISPQGGGPLELAMSYGD